MEREILLGLEERKSEYRLEIWAHVITGERPNRNTKTPH